MAQIGWRYGSNTEDVLTGYRIHCLGWRSIYFSPSRPAFRGIAPSILADRLAQRKRICCGLVEILLSRHSPLFYRCEGLALLQRAGYVYVSFFYAGISIFVVLYAALHAACLLCGNTQLIPKISDSAGIWFVLAICFQHGMSYLEYWWADASFAEWWNQERFWYISNASSFLFGTVEAFMKSVGVIQTGFTVTPKAETRENEEGDSYSLADSPFCIPLTTLAMVYAVATLTATAHVVKGGVGTFDKMFGELVCAGWWLAMTCPILRQLLNGSLSASVMLPSAVITAAFCALVSRHVC